MPYIKVGQENGTDIDLYYKDWGLGQPVVFSHGWLLTSDSWESHMFFLASNGYRCIAHDRQKSILAVLIASGILARINSIRICSTSLKRRLSKRIDVNVL